MTRAQNPRRLSPLGTLASNFLKSSLSRTAIRPTDTRLTSLPSPSRFLKAAIKQVKEWVESYIPPEHLANHDCVVDVSEVRAPLTPKAPPADRSRLARADLSRRETRSPRVSPRRRPHEPNRAHPRPPSPTQVQCGDPNCAPIDTAVRIIYKGDDQGGNVGTVFGVPCEAVDVEQSDIDEMMPPAEYFDAWHKGETRHWPPPPENPEPGEPPDVELRFKVGDRVECCIARGPDGWAPGTIVSHWFRAPQWPTGQFAPYQIKLDSSENLIFAPQDRDNCIRALKQ